MGIAFERLFHQLTRLRMGLKVAFLRDIVPNSDGTWIRNVDLTDMGTFIARSLVPGNECACLFPASFDNKGMARTAGIPKGSLPLLKAFGITWIITMTVVAGEQLPRRWIWIKHGDRGPH